MAGKFMVYKGKDGKEYFRLRPGYGEVIFSSQGYKTRNSADAAVVE